MNREIRFRIWDTVLKTMMPDFDNWIDFHGNYWTTPDKRCDNSPDLLTRTVITITRYVDKNNNCTLCGRPVGNTVFTVCDGCWDKKEQK